MKITRVTALSLSRMHELENQWFSNTFRVVKADCSIVVIETDAGITGIGEACAYGGPEQIADWVRFYEPLLTGADPLDMGTPPAPHFRSSSHDCAVSGIDCALWDIRGKASGRRVCDLLVEHFRPGAPTAALDSVRLYASSGCRYDWRGDPRQLIEEALGYIDQGYTAMKLRIGTKWEWDGVTVDRFLGLLRELTQTVRATGKPFDLALDANQRLNEAQALEIARELDVLGFAWFEEPIPQMDIAGYRRIADAAYLPITGGEQFTTLAQFRGHIDAGAYDIVQPDMGWCGLTEGMKIARYAEMRGKRVLPHNWHNGLMTMANAHFVAALPQPWLCELCMIQGPLQWAIVRNKPEIAGGHLTLSRNATGLGVGLADALESRFPYINGSWALSIEREDYASPR